MFPSMKNEKMTRLERKVRSMLLNGSLGGVWLVELAPLAAPELVPQATASAFSVREAPGRALTETLIDYLQARHVLLVLDNCEHLIDAAAALAEALLAQQPQVAAGHTERTAQVVQQRLEHAMEIGHVSHSRKRGASRRRPAHEAGLASEIPHSFIFVSSVL